MNWRNSHKKAYIKSIKGLCISATSLHATCIEHGEHTQHVHAWYKIYSIQTISHTIYIYKLYQNSVQLHNECLNLHHKWDFCTLAHVKKCNCNIFYMGCFP